VPAGEDYEARRFSTWAPMAIASIGKVASTIADRSIMIGMERKAPGQTVARMRVDRDEGFGELASKADRWIADHFEALRSADPDVPRALNDRQADNWRPLLAIADLAGGGWPAKARSAALDLSATDEDADTIGVQLLASVRLAFGLAKQISTDDLLKHLHAMSEAPWSEFGRQRKPITPRQLASLLKPFGITSGTLREGDGTYKGYRREQFESAWTRYLSVTASQLTQSASFDGFSSVTPASDVTDGKDQKTRQSAACDGVTDSEAPAGRKTANGLYTCAQCNEPIALSAGYTATSSGEVLHSRCVDQWIRS
jgi:putative DNA primase/helicase